MFRLVFSFFSTYIIVWGIPNFVRPVEGAFEWLDGQCPKTPSSRTTFCTRVESWQELKKVVNIANQQIDPILILCPFHIDDKDSEDSITVSTSMYLGCSEPRKCIIDGGGTQLKIEGENTSSIIQGIVFRGASKPALRVLSISGGHQMICHCNFIINRVKDEKGGSIKVEEDSNVIVGFSLFEQNRGIEGSAIYNRGKMEVYHSTFIGNRSSGAGGAIKNSKSGHITLHYSTFQKNKSDLGAVIATMGFRAPLPLDKGGNVVSQNIGRCVGGMYDITTEACILFGDLEFGEPPIVELPELFDMEEEYMITQSQLEQFESQPTWGVENIASRARNIMDYIRKTQPNFENSQIS